MKQVKKIIAANSTEKITDVGKYIWLKTATGEILVKTDTSESAFLVAGDFIRFDNRFTELYVEDLSGAQNSIVIVSSIEGEAGKYGNVSISAPGGLATTADFAKTATTTQLILAANANRKEAIIQFAQAARVGDSNAGAARGAEVPAGGLLTLETTAAVYAYSVLAQTITLTETELS